MRELRLKRHRKNRRKNRTRQKIVGTPKKPRLSVFRSNRYMYCQLIDDRQAKTIMGVHSKRIAPEKSVNSEVASELGKEIARRAQEKNIKRVIFDRGSSQYEGNIAALADAAREGGLKF